MNIYNRIKGGLYGVAVGDALGGTTEFMTRREIADQYGYLTDMIGGGVWHLEPGEVTDDTMMTLCVAEGILENPSEPLTAIGKRFLEWYYSNPKDIGNIIRFALRQYNGNWFDSAIEAHTTLGQSAGNGSLMRCLPAALCYTKLEDVTRIARLQSKMTHYDDRCNEACEIYCRIVYRIINEGVNIHKAVQQEIKHTKYSLMLDAEPDCEPDGFVEHTFKWVIHILLTSHSFSEVVQKAANAGGDSDTIAAIAGGVAGVHYGYEDIPESYSSKILIADRLEQVCDRIMTLRK